MANIIEFIDQSCRGWRIFRNRKSFSILVHYRLGHSVGLAMDRETATNLRDALSEILEDQDNER